MPLFLLPSLSLLLLSLLSALLAFPEMNFGAQ